LAEQKESIAAVWTGDGQFDLIDQSIPEPGPGDVVLEVGSAGICGSDLFFLGVRNEIDPIPVGHEVAGTVVAIGQGVNALSDGDRVAVEMVGLSRACMRCWFCRQGQYVKCDSQQEKRGGGFASYMCVPAQACFKLPQSLT
jgi:D-arabinose 1-dehydrogenase-like Zn-dependent alcohol dehydrogenase